MGAPVQAAAAGVPQHEPAVLAAAGQLAQRGVPGQRKDPPLVALKGRAQLQPWRRPCWTHRPQSKAGQH